MSELIPEALGRACPNGHMEKVLLLSKCNDLLQDFQSDAIVKADHLLCSMSKTRFGFAQRHNARSYPQ